MNQQHLFHHSVGKHDARKSDEYYASLELPIKISHTLHVPPQFRDTLEKILSDSSGKSEEYLGKEGEQLSFLPAFEEELSKAPPHISSISLQILYLCRQTIDGYHRTGVVDQSTSKSQLSLVSSDEVRLLVHDLEQLKGNALVPLVAFLETLEDTVLIRADVQTLLNHKKNFSVQDGVKCIRKMLKKVQELHYYLSHERSPDRRISYLTAILHDVFHLAQDLFHATSDLFEEVNHHIQDIFTVVRKNFQETIQAFPYLLHEKRAPQG